MNTADDPPIIYSQVTTVQLKKMTLNFVKEAAMTVVVSGVTITAAAMMIQQNYSSTES